MTALFRPRLGAGTALGLALATSGLPALGQESDLRVGPTIKPTGTGPTGYEVTLRIRVPEAETIAIRGE